MTLKTYITRTHIAMDVAIKANSATGAETKAVKVLSNDLVKQLMRDKKVEWIDNIQILSDEDETKYTKTNHMPMSGPALQIDDLIEETYIEDKKPKKLTQDAQPKYIRARGISEKYAVALSTVWYWQSIGKLPKPTAKLGPRCTVWDVDEVADAFQELRNETN